MREREQHHPLTSSQLLTFMRAATSISNTCNRRWPEQCRRHFGDMIKAKTAESPRKLLEEAICRGRTLGVQYGLRQPGRLCSLSCAGLATLLPPTPVTDRTTFNAYSIAKTFTAAAVLLLAERGMADLDAPIRHYLGAGVDSGSASLRQTLLHVAGFPNPNPVAWVHTAGPGALFDRQAFVQDIVHRYGRPVSVPGSSYRYSNVGYLLLGEVVARVSGMSFARYAQQCLIDPLCLKAGEQLAFAIPDCTRHAQGALRRLGWLDLALGLFVDRRQLVAGARGRWTVLHNHQVNGDAYGGLVGNAAGLLRYAQALMGAEAPFTPGVRDWLLSPVESLGPRRSLGWFAGRTQGRMWLAHAGGGAGYYAELRIYPQLGCASAVLFNRPGLRDEHALDHFDRPMLEAL